MSIYSAAAHLADTSELSHTASQMTARCRSTGLTPSSYRGIIAVAVALGLAPGSRLAGRAWQTDVEFVNAIIDLETEVMTRLKRTNEMISRYETLLTNALAEPDKNTAPITALRAALPLLYTARRRVSYALGRLMAAPDELGDTYAAAYRLVKSGRQLPHNGRFITGQNGPPAEATP
ncbi:hypothetical protein J5X84_02360 [Streptosporangiaceae bacterium NEAU-GS5]|nr:hypothetical protein [Streptosporangiaceae bacterium NEAU-GS5]